MIPTKCESYLPDMQRQSSALFDPGVAVVIARSLHSAQVCVAEMAASYTENRPTPHLPIAAAL